MKRFFVFLMALLVSAALFAGGRQAPAASGSGPMEISYPWGDGYTGLKPNPDAPVIQRLEEKFNVKFNWFPVNQNTNNEQFRLLIASGTYPDASIDWGTWDWIDQGVLRPVTEDMIAKNMPFYYTNQLLKYDPDKISLLARQMEGGYAGVPTMGINAPFYRVWRKDYLDKLGLKVPTTLAEFEAVCQAIVAGDPDGNGKNDTWPINARGVHPSTYAYIFGAYGIMPDRWSIEDGKLIRGYVTQGYKEALKALARYYKQGFFPREFLTITADQETAYYLDGRIASIYQTPYYNTMGSVGGNPYKLKQKTPEVEFARQASLTGPSGNRSLTYDWGSNNGWALHFFRQTTDEKIAKIMQIVDYCQSDEGALLISKGIEGLTYKVENGVYTSLLPMEELVKLGANGGIGLGDTELRVRFAYGQTGVDDYKFANEQPVLVDAIAKMNLPNTKDQQAALQVIYDKYFADAVTGAVDVDSTWDRYLRDCAAAGQAAYTAEAEAVYARYFKGR
ncbi:MAG: extracellular solute-binding protein [Treponema sp.]|jgi:putative aldouronate transport system substrate-binding protein|nr:extracellular solute-binding protein [Treponema sp.]